MGLAEARPNSPVVLRIDISIPALQIKAISRKQVGKGKNWKEEWEMVGKTGIRKQLKAFKIAENPCKIDDTSNKKAFKNYNEFSVNFPKSIWAEMGI